jgi:hypothetical protein
MTDPVTADDVAAATVALDTKADAKNRGLRTALQVLAVALVVDLLPWLISTVDRIDAGESVRLGSVLLAGLRIVLSGLLAWVLRYVAPPPAPEG